MFELAKEAVQQLGFYHAPPPAYETRSTQHITALLPLLTDPARDAVEVGGGFGAGALAMARLASHVHVFEPHPRLQRLLRAKLPGNTSVHGVALSDLARATHLSVPFFGGRFRDDQGRIAVQRDDAETVDVACRRLDDVLRDDVGCIRIDVGSHELHILEGATETLAKARSIVVIQTEARAEEMQIVEGASRFFEPRDYVGLVIDRDRAAPIGPATRRIRSSQRLDQPETAAGATLVFVPSENNPSYIADGIEWLLDRSEARRRSRHR